MNRSGAENFVRHPIVVATSVLIIASALALAVGMPVARVTQIAVYTLYSAGVNFLIGYLGLVPFATCRRSDDIG